MQGQQACKNGGKVLLHQCREWDWHCLSQCSTKFSAIQFSQSRTTNQPDIHTSQTEVTCLRLLTSSKVLLPWGSSITQISKAADSNTTSLDFSVRAKTLYPPQLAMQVHQCTHAKTEVKEAKDNSNLETPLPPIFLWVPLVSAKRCTPSQTWLETLKMVSENQLKKKEKRKNNNLLQSPCFVQTWKLSQFLLRVNSVDANIEILCKT